jgi:hypothetical protein
MLAADRSLLEINLKQSAIKLREKELNLYTDNFSAMATQAAVLAGFTTTCLIEISIPPDAHPLAKNCLHISAIFSICSNIACVSLSTITNIWGSGKALRGKDGSMDEAVEGINAERALIFRAFAFGLCGNLCTVLFACFITMSMPINFVAATMVLYTAYLIYGNAIRIQKKFHMADVVRLDDLTAFPTAGSNGMTTSNADLESQQRTSVAAAAAAPLLGHRSRNKLIDV